MLGWTVRPLTPETFALILDPTTFGRSSNYEGEVLVALSCIDPKESPPTSRIPSMVRETFGTFGDLKAFKIMQASGPGDADFHLEYFDTNIVQRALRLDKCKVQV